MSLQLAVSNEVVELSTPELIAVLSVNEVGAISINRANEIKKHYNVDVEFLIGKGLLKIVQDGAIGSVITLTALAQAHVNRALTFINSK